ncbi:MAG TPA: hypothetical protein VGI85_15135 [Chthoniobacterales bacterium]|jgi:hypothetical protein
MDKHGHLTSEEREAYWERTLAPAALVEVSDHLQSCVECREELRRQRPPAIRSDEPVAYEDLLALMEENLDPLTRRDLAERINSSPKAAAELADLLRFREQMDRLPSRDYALDEEASGRFSWVLPIAAGLALGFAFFWWSSMEHRVHSGIVLRDAGESIVVRPSGAVPALGPLPPDLQNAVHAAASGELKLSPTVKGLRATSETLAGGRSAATGFEVVAPVGTVVASTQPTFHWKRESHANGYRVNILPRGSGALASSPVLNAAQTEWTPRGPLQPNESYEWEVEALHNGEMIAKAPTPPAPGARFAILPNEKREMLEKLRKKFGTSHLLMGVAYAEVGLVPEARAEFQALVQENPQSVLPRKLLAGLTTAIQ